MRARIRTLALGTLALGTFALGTLVARAADAAGRAPASRIESLGKQLFEDTNLSLSRTQSCATCHVQQQAFTGNNHPDPLFPVAIGDSRSLVGVRNTPTAMYAAFIPTFGFIDDEGEWIPQGGQFWDGRADTLAAQAAGPFINPREMAMPSKASVIARIQNARYANLFKRVFGSDIFCDTERAYTAMTEAIAAFEQTERFLPFSSKFDDVLRGQRRFTADERRGFELFADPEKGNCMACHTGAPGSRNPADWLFTDFTYDNLGVPRNTDIPDNADPEHFDLGLCAQPGIETRVPDDVQDQAEFIASFCGAFKVPTLRNVARTAPYMHNGFFTSLRDVVRFYVTRDTNPEKWYPTVHGAVSKFNDLPAEYRGNVNTSEPPYDGGLGGEPRLSEQEIDLVVKFLQTLSDKR